MTGDDFYDYRTADFLVRFIWNGKKINNKSCSVSRFLSDFALSSFNMWFKIVFCEQELANRGVSRNDYHLGITFFAVTIVWAGKKKTWDGSTGPNPPIGVLFAPSILIIHVFFSDTLQTFLHSGKLIVYNPFWPNVHMQRKEMRRLSILHSLNTELVISGMS